MAGLSDVLGHGNAGGSSVQTEPHGFASLLWKRDRRQRALTDTDRCCSSPSVLHFFILVVMDVNMCFCFIFSAALRFPCHCPDMMEFLPLPDVGAIAGGTLLLRVRRGAISAGPASSPTIAELEDLLALCDSRHLSTCSPGTYG